MALRMVCVVVPAMDSSRSPSQLVILGAGGFAREVLDVYDACNEFGWGPFDILGFLAEGEPPGSIINDRPILGEIDWLSDHPGVLTICGIGEPGTRRRVVRRAAQLGAQFHTVIHPDARLTRWVEIGPGSVVTAGCILTNQIRVGSHVHLNLDTTVGHDCVIEDFVTVAPGVHISGNVTLEEGCNVGTGAVIIQGHRIGAGSVIGAGAVVNADIPPDSVAVGVPAKVVKSRTPGWADPSS
jgi:sugar O-acyltransferase (sialic acid O-acetyltransferase NeuD family)